MPGLHHVRRSHQPPDRRLVQPLTGGLSIHPVAEPLEDGGVDTVDDHADRAVAHGEIRAPGVRAAEPAVANLTVVGIDVVLSRRVLRRSTGIRVVACVDVLVVARSQSLVVVLDPEKLLSDEDLVGRAVADIADADLAATSPREACSTGRSR